MRLNIDLVDTLTLFTSGITGPDIQQVGSDPVLEDDSDATYVDVVGKFLGPSNPAFLSRFDAYLSAQSFDGHGIAVTDSRLRFMVDIRIKGLQAGLPFPQVRLIAANSTYYTPVSTPAGTLPTSPTMISLEMAGFGTAWTGPDSYKLQVFGVAPSPVPGATGDIQTRNWYVYELHPYWYVKTYGAPPCRITGRGDDLGVGAGRAYPPSKMQQTSSRGVGAY